MTTEFVGTTDGIFEVDSRSANGLIIEEGDNDQLVARCGSVTLTADSPAELLAAIWAEVEVDYPDTVSPEDYGYARYEYIMSLGGVRLAKADAWLLAGWVSRGASQDLDGSGLSFWGDNQPGGWRVCVSDGAEHGLREIAVAYRQAISDAISPELHDLFDVLESVDISQDISSPDCPEPDAEWVHSEIDGLRHTVTAAQVGDRTVLIGQCLDHVVVASESEYVVDPDEDDVERIVKELVVAAAEREGLWAEEISALEKLLKD